MTSDATLSSSPVLFTLDDLLTTPGRTTQLWQRLRANPDDLPSWCIPATVPSDRDDPNSIASNLLITASSACSSEPERDQLVDQAVRLARRYASRCDCPSWAATYVGMPMLGVQLTARLLIEPWADPDTSDDPRLAALLKAAVAQLPGSPRSSVPGRVTAWGAVHRHLRTWHPDLETRQPLLRDLVRGGLAGTDVYAACVRALLRGVARQHPAPQPAVLHRALHALMA